MWRDVAFVGKDNAELLSCCEKGIGDGGTCRGYDALHLLRELPRSVKLFLLLVYECLQLSYLLKSRVVLRSLRSEPVL